MGGMALSEFPKPQPARPQRPLLGRGGFPACALPAAQGSLCEPFPRAPTGNSRAQPLNGPIQTPALSGKFLCFLTPSALAWRAGPNRLPLPRTRRALRAGGSMVRASQLLQFLPGPQLDRALAG